MDIQIIPPRIAPPTPRAHVISLVIKSFKGRRNVEIHLFRPVGEDMGEDYDWNELIEDHHHPEVERNYDATQRFILEAFTEAERDRVIAYLKERYQSKLDSITSCTIDFPVPLGITPLSDIAEGKTSGFIRFDEIPNYSLDFPLRGFYDLSQHEPLVQEPTGRNQD